MNEEFMKFFLGIVGTIAALLLGLYKFVIEVKKKNQEEIKKEQRFNYFLPFKFSVSEFSDRIKHIEETLNYRSEKDNEKCIEGIKSTSMKKRLYQSYKENITKEWFFCDDKNTDGGYFINSTIYLNCILFFRMKLISSNYPYIPLKQKLKLNELPMKGNVQINRCLKISSSKRKISNSKLNKKYIDVDVYIKNIKIALSQANGIPYALQDSFGDYVSSNGKLLNYNQFVELLIDKEKRIMFEPLLKFWTNIMKNENEVSIERLDKLRCVIPLFELVENAELK
jgi:hypothetical protein